MIKKKLNYNKYLELNNKYEKIVNNLASIRLIVFITMIISFILKHYYYELFFNFLFITNLIAFIILIIIHDKYYKIYNYYHKYLEIIEEYIKRTTGEWKDFQDTGKEFLTNNNSYLSDLDILGDSSLYQLLNIAKTKGGKRKLVSRLSNNKLEKLEEEQDAIKELSNNINFCIDYQVYLSKYNNTNTDLSTNFNDLSKSIPLKKHHLIIGIILSSLTIIILILILLRKIDINYFYITFIINFLINYIYSYIYSKEFIKLNKIIKTYSTMHKLFNSILNTSFKSKKLSNIKKNINSNYNNIKTLEKFEILNDLRNNLISNFLFNGILNLNVFILYFFSKFINNNLSKLKNNIDDIEEVEAIISIAGLGIIKENISIPIKSEKIELTFNNIHHPLLDENKCVTNDFKTNNGINIITGSNMGGKTSFIRTIGINMILMNAGGYVCATNFKANYFKIFTSMRINDDIEKGISTFYAELLRIKDMIEYLNKDNMLVLIDEIFKGTNYQDRIYGAKEVITKLNNNKTITFLTTHDFELCDVKNVNNYHVKEYYEDNKICFDYKIREGKSNSTNAKYLMKKLNIID